MWGFSDSAPRGAAVGCDAASARCYSAATPGGGGVAGPAELSRLRAQLQDSRQVQEEERQAWLQERDRLLVEIRDARESAAAGAPHAAERDPSQTQLAPRDAAGDFRTQVSEDEQVLKQ